MNILMPKPSRYFLLRTYSDRYAAGDAIAGVLRNCTFSCVILNFFFFSFSSDDDTVATALFLFQNRGQYARRISLLVEE